MNETHLIRSKVRQRRIALQKSIGLIHNEPKTESIEIKPFTKVADLVGVVVKEKEKKKPEHPEERIEITAEVVTDISGDLKEELKKKKKRRLKELRKSSSQKADMVYELNVINPEAENGNISPPSFDPGRHGESTRLLPRPTRQKHGMDNAAWSSTEEPSDFQEGNLPLYKKLLPLKSMYTDVETNKSPYRMARRQRASNSGGNRLSETVIDMMEFNKDYDTEASIAQKLRARRRQGLNDRKKSTSSQFTSASDAVTEEEAYDFFTRVWEEEEEEEVESQSKSVSEPTNVKSPNIPDIIVQEDNPEDTAILISQDFCLKEDELFITKFSRPEYVTTQKKIAQEKEFLFLPSKEPVPLQSKYVDEGAEHHDLGDNLPSQTNLNLKVSNVNVIENRIVKEKALHWFGEDGFLKFLPNPYSYYPFQDFLVDESKLPNVIHIKADLETSKQRLSGEKTYELDLDISSLTFTHHPLFSKEHVVASSLTQMCEKYVASVQTNVVQVLKQKLKTLRSTLTKLKQAESLKTSFNDQASPKLALTTRAYIEEIKQTRKLRDMKELEQQNLLKNIRTTWKELASLRETQGFNSTSINLEINDEEQNETVDLEALENDVKRDFDEEREEFEVQYANNLEKYSGLLMKWKDYSKAKKQIARKQKKKDRVKASSTTEMDDNAKTTEDLETVGRDEERISSVPKMEKPQPPLKFDATKTFERLMENALKTRRKPGAPKTSIKVKFDLAATPSDKCPKSEIQRRRDVSSAKLHFRIMFNDKKVSETLPLSLNQDFHSFWGQIFKLRIVHFPVSFKLEIYQSGVSKKSKLAEVYLPVPDASQTSTTTNLEDHEFGSDEIVSFRHAAIGSGILFNFANGDRRWLLTGGNVRCSLAWGVAEDGAVLAPPKAEETESIVSAMKKSLPLYPIFCSNIINLSQLREEIEKFHIDPNDPSSLKVFQEIQDYRADNEDTNSENYFRLEPLQESFEFMSFQDLENNNRFRLLEMRSKGLPEFRNYPMIPADEADISIEIIEQLQAKYSESSSVNEQAQPPRQAQNIRHQVREEVAKRYYLSQHQKTLEDVIIEEKVPDIGTLGFNLLKLFQRKRPLYPMRKERKKVTGQTAVNSEVKIMVTVLHAINVPVRTDIDPVKERIRSQGSTIHETEDTFESQIRPFVEVMFQRVAVRTSVADGPHPTWNQELILPFCAENGDFSPPNLERVTDEIYFNIFDEITVDLLEDDKDRESLVHQRLERRWLGNLRIPFTTLYLNSKIEGTFQVNTPPVLLGYQCEHQPWMTTSSDAPPIQTHLSLFVTIEPCLQLPEVFREKCNSGESEKVLREVERWHENVISRFPERLIKVMAVDLSGQWIFVSRFLRVIPPPEELLQESKDSVETWERLARFVSLIPTVADSVVFPGLCDIWSTCEQFLQMLMGDQEEHSMLLCNFFLHLGKKAMLLLGYGIPDGPTSYVITWETDGDVWLWNGSSEHHYSIRDSYTPLQRVGCIISPDNVWANIQKNDHPSRMNFDLSKAGDWKPFFHKAFPNLGFKSIQPATLTYTPTDEEFVKNLQETIKKSLQENIMKWRRRHCTSWNAYCSKVLYKILTRLEKSAGQAASMESLQELEQVLSSHKISGFPLSMPYTDIDAVIEAVFATGVHLTEDKNAEFSLAVHLHPYPCSVIAVWVYVAVLVSRRAPDIE